MFACQLRCRIPQPGPNNYLVMWICYLPSNKTDEDDLDIKKSSNHSKEQCLAAGK